MGLHLLYLGELSWTPFSARACYLNATRMCSEPSSSSCMDPKQPRKGTPTHMEPLEEKTKNLERLLKASREGDVAAVRALLERGSVDVNGANEVRVECSPPPLFSTRVQRVLVLERYFSSLKSLAEDLCLFRACSCECVSGCECWSSVLENIF
jgi:hypothetical protein